MKKLIVIILVFCTTNAWAQTDSIRNAILQYRDTTLTTMVNGRQLLREKLKTGSYDEIRDLALYLLDFSDQENVVVFNFPEYIFLSYWVQDYHKLFPETTKPASDIVMGPTKEVIFKPEDRLLEYLADKTRFSLSFLISLIDNSDYTTVERDFLTLNLRNMLRAFFNSREITDSLNVLADRFLEKYPGSEYETFVRQNIRYEFIPSDWNWGINLFSGYGFINGDLKKDFTNNIPLGLSFEMGYKKFLLFIRIQGGFAFTQKDITYPSGVWPKGAQVRAYVFESSLGYTLFENRKLRLTPFAGFSGLEISPTDHDMEKKPELKQAKLDFTGGYAAGLNTDIKLNIAQSKTHLYEHENTTYLQLRYTWHGADFKKKYALEGNMHSVTIGIGGFTRRIKRSL